jgi:hypothetical protein
MKAYFDESGKHHQASVLSIFGLLMSAETCKELQRRWFREAARPPMIPLPFHMSHCVSGRGAFAHIDEDGRLKMQERMIRTINGLDVQAYGASVIRGDHQKVVATLQPNQTLRDPWFLAFEGGIAAMMKASSEAGKPHSITSVFDRQEEFSIRAHQLYNDILATDLPYVDRLGSLSFSPKDKVAALQAIDLIVNEINRRWEECYLQGLRESWRHKLINELISVKGFLFDAQVLQSMVKEKATGVQTDPLA